MDAKAGAGLQVGDVKVEVSRSPSEPSCLSDPSWATESRPLGERLGMTQAQVKPKPLQERVVFEKGACCDKMPMPPFPEALARAGVLKKDYKKLCRTIIETEEGMFVIGLPLTICFVGICYIMYLGFAAEADVEAFNKKYMATGIHVKVLTHYAGGARTADGGRGGPFTLCFTYPPPVGAGLGGARVVMGAPVVMERDA